MVAGKARRLGKDTGLSQKRNKFSLYALGRQNDSQVGAEQFSSQEGFTPINQTGLQDTSKALGDGSQFGGAIGFKFRLCELDSDTSTVDITKAVASGDVFDTAPGDCSALITGSGGGAMISDLEFINFPKWQGHRLSIYLNDGQTVTVKHTVGATIYAIKTPTEADVVFTTAEQVISFAWSVTLGQWLLLTSAGGGGGAQCPLICTENDLGNISGVVDVDWSIANFHRGVLTGDVTFNLINTPGDGDWQDICLEVQQDAVGGHTVSFQQPMANGFIPQTFLGALRYTSWQIYVYEEPGGTDIFHGFDKSGSTGPDVPGSGGVFQGFSGYIQAILSSDQLAVAPGLHIEFDTIVKADTLTVSASPGQGSGIFSGFRVGHVYECNVYVASFGLAGVPPAEISAKWFDIQGGVFIGTHAKTISMDDPKTTNFQHIGTAYFEPTMLGSSLLCEIISNIGAIGIHDGGSASDPLTFATIKDCGVTEAVINQPIPAPEDIILDIREMTYLNVSPNSSAFRFSNWQGNLNNSTVDISQRVSQSGVIKSLIINVDQKGAGDINFNMMKNGSPFGPTFVLTAGAGTGVVEFPGTNLFWEVGDTLGWRTTGGVGGQPGGDQWNMTMVVWWT
jgi:hypothetical protein